MNQLSEIKDDFFKSRWSKRLDYFFLQKLGLGEELRTEEGSEHTPVLFSGPSTTWPDSSTLLFY